MGTILAAISHKMIGGQFLTALLEPVHRRARKPLHRLPPGTRGLTAISHIGAVHGRENAGMIRRRRRLASGKRTAEAMSHNGPVNGSKVPGMIARSGLRATTHGMGCSRHL